MYILIELAQSVVAKYTFAAKSGKKVHRLVCVPISDGWYIRTIAFRGSLQINKRYIGFSGGSHQSYRPCHPPLFLIRWCFRKFWVYKHRIRNIFACCVAETCLPNTKASRIMGFCNAYIRQCAGSFTKLGFIVYGHLIRIAAQYYTRKSGGPWLIYLDLYSFQEEYNLALKKI